MLLFQSKKVQEIVNKTYKSGDPILVNNKWNHKIKIESSVQFGVSVNKNNGDETLTNKGVIHFSKTGTHLVPRKEDSHET